MSSANPELGHWWRSSSLRIALVSGLSMWLLNSLLVLGLYDFTLRALVGDIGRGIDAKIEKRLAGWPKQLPKHAGVTSWLYRQLAVEIADLQDCVALADADGELQLSNINRTGQPEFRYREFYTATFTGHRWQQQNSSSEDAICLVTERILTDGGRLIYGVPFDSYLLTIQQLNKLRLWGLFLTAVLSLVVTLSVTLRQLRRLRVIYQACERVASGDLKQRIEVTGRDDDLDHIAAVINHMLDQIAQLMDGVREVSDAIAHDLKTP
ncbi:MAG TPA: HAMP domain-containing protein, partial [Spongiibacteraceae bacterium]|nr:HAMP domain-containing protein [Spongiibacteraceae bacterium]